tara:strand:+ start:2673 stop:2789 length:117 start_codon:yes stop_codon:yes gene_type:complete
MTILLFTWILLAIVGFILWGYLILNDKEFLNEIRKLFK